MPSFAQLGLHPIDLAVLAAYFAAVLYLGVFLGAKQTKTLGDFFVAGGKWGPLVSFVFVFASAIAGNEAVVVSGKAYHVGLAGVWLWWNFLFATPIYYLFSTYYRRARVYNLAEFLEMRFGHRVAALYAVVATVICVLFIGMFLKAVSVILAGFTGLPLYACIAGISLVVAAYIFSGGMMSALLTDLLQGVMCLVILGFVMLPFLWNAAGGWETLRSLPVETWNFTNEGMTLPYILALNATALFGGVAAPWIYNWMAVSRNERAATQCAWGHLWKRVVTLLFALYGIFFAVLAPGLEGSESEYAWGRVMRDVLPVGVGVVGLLIASFFAAAMSSADTYAATSAAMAVDFLYRRVLRPGASLAHYLTTARFWSVASIALAALSTVFIDGIKDYVNLTFSLLSFLGAPIYFGVVWRRANRTGMWVSLGLGIAAYLVIWAWPRGEERWLATNEEAFAAQVFVSTGLACAGMWLGSLLGPAEEKRRLDRFYVVMNTPIGQERRLVEASVRLPALVDAGLVADGPEQLDNAALESLYAEYAQTKLFGPNSSIELRRDPTLTWYIPGFIAVTFACVGLVAGTWLATRLLFVWT